MATLKTNETEYSAWNPGLQSQVPNEYCELETIYSPANVLTSLDEINQLSSETGLNHLELVSFRPQRIVLQELIVRITADIVVLEGEAEEALGINFRQIATRIYQQYILPRMPQIETLFEQDCLRLGTLVKTELATAFERLRPPKPPAPTFWQRLTGGTPPPQQSAAQPSREERELNLVNEYKVRRLETDDEYLAAVFRSLYKILGSIARSRGFLGSDANYLVPICTRHACDYLARKHIGQQVGEMVDQAILSEGYHRIPDSQNPVLFSLKGASASGKSHLRPMLRSKMATLGIADHSYGTISPDIWRKLLLDYESLGEAYKYAGRFTSHEVSIIDAILDRYIRDKAERNQAIPHLVVDRFRFDSFASEKIGRVLHNTYVRHIDTMYMYFIVTPPEATVERGWARGLERGRFKAVEDYLAHCVEAYSGMPRVLFKWLANDKPRYSFKFMDNSVPKESLPTLIARGSQGWLQLFAPERFIDIERFRRINIRACSPEQVHAEPKDLVVSKNLGFLRQCIERFDRIEMAESENSPIYLTIVAGEFQVGDGSVFKHKLADETLRAILAEFAPQLLPQDPV